MNAIVKYLFLLLPAVSRADEIGLRLNSAITPDNSAIVQFPTSSQGKIVEVLYDWEPHSNLYLEGSLGYRAPDDLFGFASTVMELSPGVRIEAGYLVLKLSEGVSYMPQNNFDPVTFNGYQKIDFVTHLTIGLKDPKTGMGLYFDRAHYSNGSDSNNPSLNYTGFMFQFKL